MDITDARQKRRHERQECRNDVLSLVFDWSNYSNSKLISLGVAIIQYLQLEEYDGGEWDFLLRAVVPRLNDFCRTKAEKEWMLSNLALNVLRLGMTKTQSELLYQEIISPWSVFMPGNEEDLEE